MWKLFLRINLRRILKITFQILLSCNLLLISANSFALTAQIFTDTTHPVATDQVNKNVEISYYNLDQLKNVLNKINAAINTKNTAIAAIQAKNLIEQNKEQFRTATSGIKYVHQYNITKIPAIVFDGGVYQIEGQNNLAIAIQEYQAWQKTHKK